MKDLPFTWHGNGSLAPKGETIYPRPPRPALYADPPAMTYKGEAPFFIPGSTCFATSSRFTGICFTTSPRTTYRGSALSA